MIAISTVTILASVADIVLRAIGKHEKGEFSVVLTGTEFAELT